MHHLHLLLVLLIVIHHVMADSSAFQFYFNKECVGCYGGHFNTATSTSCHSNAMRMVVNIRHIPRRTTKMESFFHCGVSLKATTKTQVDLISLIPPLVLKNILHSRKTNDKQLSFPKNGEICCVEDTIPSKKSTRNKKRSKAAKSSRVIENIKTTPPCIDPLYWTDDADPVVCHFAPRIKNDIINNNDFNNNNNKTVPTQISNSKKESKLTTSFLTAIQTTTTTTSSQYSGGTSMLRFTIRGKPIPLRRHRTAKGFVYNPSALAQSVFRSVVQSVLPMEQMRACRSSSSSSSSQQSTFFTEDQHLIMSIICRMKRPQSHFRGNKRGDGRLRERIGIVASSSSSSSSSSTKFVNGRSADVDNLTKFVLDSLNELVYVDDRQVVSLSVSRVYDWEGECNGATEISIRSIATDEELNDVLSKQHVVF